LFGLLIQNGMKHQNRMKTDEVVEKKFGVAEKLG
jgi:hypothetical protein